MQLVVEFLSCNEIGVYFLILRRRHLPHHLFYRGITRYYAAHVIDSNNAIVFRQSDMPGNIASQNHLRNFDPTEKLGGSACTDIKDNAISPRILMFS